MALSSDALDLAILCSSKAKEFVKSDKEFIIISPIISNSSVIVLNNYNYKTIGVSSKRQYELDLLKDLLVKEYDVKELSTNILPYAMERNDVDGIVIDYSKALELKGEKIFPSKGRAYGTYSLVVRKDFLNNVKYEKFIEAYNDTVDYLMKDYNLLRKLEEKNNSRYLDERGKNEWQALNMKIHRIEK